MKTYKEFSSEAHHIDEAALGIGTALKAIKNLVGGEVNFIRKKLKDKGTPIDNVEGKDLAGLPKGS